MGNYESKLQECLETEKKFRSKVGHSCKTRGHFYAPYPAKVHYGNIANRH